MRNEVAEMFGIDPMGEEVQLVRRQNRNDNDMLEHLILLREAKFPRLKDFAEEIGFDEKFVSDFEDQPTSASIRFLQMYALGLGVEIQHKVVTPEERRAQKRQSENDIVLFLVEQWAPETVSAGSAGRSAFRKIELEGPQHV